MVKDIIEFILFSFILTFLWNSVRRMLFPAQKNPARPEATQQTAQRQGRSRNPHGLNWDAEDAEFEEIKDEEKLKK